jgi:hypothetical protein
MSCLGRSSPICDSAEHMYEEAAGAVELEGVASDHIYDVGSRVEDDVSAGNRRTSEAVYDNNGRSSPGAN